MSHSDALMLQVVPEISVSESLIRHGKIHPSVRNLYATHFYSFYFLELSVKITVSDINGDMLDVGKKRAVERGSFHELDFKVLNAEDLSSFEDNSHDLYTIAFGIRNVTDRAKALKEAHRILRKGGRFMCLEFSEVVVPGFK